MHSLLFRMQHRSNIPVSTRSLYIRVVHYASGVRNFLVVIRNCDGYGLRITVILGITNYGGGSFFVILHIPNYVAGAKVVILRDFDYD